VIGAGPTQGAGCRALAIALWIIFLFSARLTHAAAVAPGRAPLSAKEFVMPSFGLPSARAEASRRNGAKARGPKTPEGKARSAQNALKHGFRAQKRIVLPGEDGAAFLPAPARHSLSLLRHSPLPDAGADAQTIRPAPGHRFGQSAAPCPLRPFWRGHGFPP
jgi:hypothetical protein